jgi:aryl-alcohol dehydrogenase-like predicted oxidoreductase
MQTRTLGRLWPVSALTLGGGGLGQVWGATTRDEAIATLHEAVDAGITLLDMAPLYGNGEAETVVGEAFGGVLPPGLRVTTKHMLGNPPPHEIYGRLSRSLDESLDRLRLKHIDLFILHGMIASEAPEGATRRTSRDNFRSALVPAFERLIGEGRIGAWGITAVGEPGAVIETMEEDPAPFAAQCIANLLDSAGSMVRSPEDCRPREIIASARRNAIGVLGIRAVQAGALTDRIDRELPDDHPEMRDYRRAAGFRAYARVHGFAPALLAHRYALSIPGVDSVVLGVKNRTELRECLEAEAAGPLSATEIADIDASVATR